MKRRSIRILSLLLAFIMIAGMLETPLGAFTAIAVDTADDVVTPVIPDATKYYVNNAFETLSGGVIDTSGLNLVPESQGNVVKVSKENGYIYMEKNAEENPEVSRSDLSRLITSPYVVVEVALASTKLSGAALKLTGTATAPAQAATLPFVTVDAQGKIYALGTDTGKAIAADGAFVTVSLAIDSVANTYSLWIGGEAAVQGASIGTEAFGKISGLAIELNGEVTNAANLMVDDLKVYSYAEEPASNEPVEVYYNNDFSANADGITFATMSGTAVNYSKYDADGDYLYLRVHNNRNDQAAFWNKNGTVALPDQFVVSFDIAAQEKMSDWRMNLVDENGNKINVLFANNNGYLNRLYSVNGTNKANNTGFPKTAAGEAVQFNSVVLLFDMATKTYSYRGYGDKGAADTDMTFRGAAAFGSVKYIEFTSRGDDPADGSTAKNLLVDNLKIYSGTQVVENFDSQEQLPGGSDPSLPNAVLYSNDFDTNDDGITYKTTGLGSGINYSERKVDANDNGYLYLRVHEYAQGCVFWNKGTGNQGILDLPDQFVISFDFAAVDAWAESRFNLVYEDGTRCNVLFGNQKGPFKILQAPSGATATDMPKSTEDNITFYPLALAFDMTNGTYSYKFTNASGTTEGTYSLRGYDANKKVQYIEFYPRGNDTTDGSTAPNLLIDNLQIYRGTEIVDDPGSLDQVPGGTEPEKPLGVLYENDFTANDSGITYKTTGLGSGINYSERKVDANGNGYLYLRVHEYAQGCVFWNKGEGNQGILDLPEKFTVSFDFAAVDAWADARFNLVYEDGTRCNVLFGNQKGPFKVLQAPSGATATNVPKSTADNITFYPISLSFDMTNGTYAYKFTNANGTAEGTYSLRGYDANKEVQYIEFYPRGNDTTDGSTAPNLLIDNLKITDDTVGQPAPMPGNVPPVFDSYINDSFEKAVGNSELDLTPKSSANTAVLKEANHYVQLEKISETGNNPYLGVDLSNLIDSKKVVISADVASTDFKSAKFYFNGQSGLGPNIVANNVQWDSQNQFGGQSITAEANGEFVNITVVFDLEAKTYDYWFNGTYLTSGEWTTGLTDLRISVETAGESLKVDNLKIYSYEKEPEPVDVYYNNDFSANADGITFAVMSGNAINYSKYDEAGKYLYLRVHNNRDDRAAFWNKADNGKAAIALPEQFVVSFDIAALEKMSDWRLNLVDESGNKIQVLFSNNSGYLNRLYVDETGANKANNSSFPVSAAGTEAQFNTVALVFDMATKTYSYKGYGSKGEADSNLKFRGAANFGTVQYIEFTSRGDDVEGATAKNLLIDNLKVYGGNEVLTNVGAQNKFPAPEGPPEDLKVWYNNDFSANANGIEMPAMTGNSVNYSKYDEAGDYLYLRVHNNRDDRAAIWNRGAYEQAAIALPDQFVVSFDVGAIGSMSAWRLNLVDEYGNKINVLFANNNGYVNRLYVNDAGENKAHNNSFPKSAAGTDVQFKPIVLVFDMATDTYSYRGFGDTGDKDTNMKFRGAANFGKVQYIEFTSRGDDPADGSVAPNLVIDNLKVYGGTEVYEDVGPQNQFPDPNGPAMPEFPRPEGVDPGNGRYYASDLEDGSKAELTLLGGSDIKQEANGNHCVFMNIGSRWSWNYYKNWELSEYVVFEASVSNTGKGTLFIQPADESDNSFYAIKLVDAVAHTPAHNDTTTKLQKGEWVDIAIAINSVDRLYTVWFDGIPVAMNKKLPDSFGIASRFIFSMNGEDMANMQWRVDNIKAYQGFCPDDYKNTVQLEEQPRDESYLDEWMGKESPDLNYATEELAIIKAAGAVMVNTETLYIYQNGARTKGTQAQVDAIVKNTAGKKVVKNGLGLVIISSSDLNLTDKQIKALHNYMIYVRPSAATLKSMFSSVTKGEHPRIILNQDRIDQIRADYKSNDMVKEWADRIIRSASLRVKSRHIEFSDESFTNSMHSIYKQLAMAYLLTGDAKFKDYLWEDIKNVCEFPNWRHHTFLAMGDAGSAMAIAYDWLYDEWTPEQRQIMEKAIYNNILYHTHKMIYGKAAGSGTFITSETNRNAVTNGGIGMVCIAIYDAYPEKIADILEKTYHQLEIMMYEFAPDGANLEGPAYWDYQMDYLVPFLQTTVNTFGTDFGIMDAPGFDTTADFYLDIDGMTGVNNLHDAAGDDHGFNGGVFALSNMLGRPDLTRALLAKMDIYNADDGINSLLYYDSSIKYDGTVDKALDAYYRNLELVSMRSSWLNSAGIFASLHAGGHTGNSHDHVDTGSFVLDIGGQRFASDYGKEDYNLGAINDYRHYYFRIRPEGHNVFVINPDKTGQDYGMNHVSESVTKFVTKSRGAYTVISMDKTYAGYANSASRGMMLGDDRKSVLIRDEIRGMTNATNEVWWFMQMQHVDVEIAKDGKSAILTKNGVQVHMQVASNASDWEIKLLEPREMYPLEGLPGLDKQNPNTNYSRLAIVFKTGKDVNINVKFAELGNPKGDTPIKDVALANWSIPDGVLEADPVLQGIEIGGVEIPGFLQNQTFYNFELPYGTEECPDVKVIGGEGCKIEIKKPKYLPDYLTVTVTSNANSSNQTKYRIYLTVSGPIKVEVSATPEPQNHAKNLLDGNLKTKWACSGAGWALFTFPSPQKVDAIWLCAMEMTLRVQPFDIEVSEDGVNFKKVWEGTTTMLPEGSKDQLEEFKIPEGEYKAIRINVTGARYPDGKEYSWSSIFEVMFYHQGKPIEIILQTSDPDKEFNENPNEDVEGNDKKDPIATEPDEPDATEPSDDVIDTTEEKGDSGMVWLIVGLCVAALLVAGAIVFIVIKKKKAAATPTEAEEAETPADSVTE